MASGCAGSSQGGSNRYAGPAGDPLSISRNRATFAPPQPSPPPPAADEYESAAARAAAAELGPEVAADIPLPATEAPARKPADPGAEALVASIAAALPDESRSANGAESDTIIALRRIRNHSRSGRDEFAAFLERFAALLTEAAADERIRFTAGDERADYLLSGTGYLMTASGFDQWELYLSLSRAGEGRDWPLWHSKNPVHVLRMPRPDASQIMPTNGPD